MARLAIMSLGPLQITLGDRPATGFESEKARALLAYLAVESRLPHSRETLTGLLWPEAPEERAHQSLSQALSNVRHAIGDRSPAQGMPFLEVTRQAVGFNRASDYWLDVEQFISLRDTNGQLPWAKPALAQLEGAMAVYRGSFLEGVALNGSPEFEEWALMQREHLHRLAQETLARLVEGFTRLGELDRALHYAWRQLDLDPWHEGAHRQVMRLLALTGQRTAALAHYATCCAVLRKELGAPPEPETTELYEAIRRGSSGAPFSLAPGTRSPSIPPHNLPAQLTPLIDREAELTAIAELLADPQCRLLTLAGPGGIGKTRLALAAAAQAVPGFPDGAFLVSLAALSSPAEVPSTVSRTLGVVREGSASEAEQLRSYLRSRSLLLILDSVEHLIRPESDSHEADRPGGTDAAPELASLLAALLESAPGLKVLLTSRVALGLLGEQLFPVRELAHPGEAPLEIEALASLAAVRLFVQGARLQRPDFTLTEDNAAAVHAICRYLEGVPLAILLSASWLSALSPAAIAEKLATQEGLRLLERDWPNVPARQRSMRAVFDSSWQLLARREQAIFAALSAFRSPFTQEAALEVAGAAPRDLHSLVSASLLSRDATGRYTMHLLLHEYAEGRLEFDAVKACTVRDRHCGYTTARLLAWARDFKGPRQADAMREMDAELGDALAAWQWAIDVGDLDRMDHAAEGFVRYASSRGVNNATIRMCAAAIRRLEGMDCPEPDAEALRARVLARHLTWLGWYQPAEALTAAKRSLALLESPALAGLDVRIDRMLALHLMGCMSIDRDAAAAQACLEECVALAHACGDAYEEGHMLLGVAAQACQMSRFEAAGRAFERARALALKVGDARCAAKASGGLAHLAFFSGRFDESVHLAAEATRLGRETANPVEISTGLRTMAALLLTGLGRFAEALELVAELRLLWRDLPGELAVAAPSLTGWARMNAGSYAEAQVDAEAMLDEVRKLERTPGAGNRQDLMAGAHALRGTIALALGEPAEAESALRAAVALQRPLAQPMVLALSLACFACSLLAQGKVEEARATLCESLRLALETGNFLVLIYALAVAARLLVSRGEAASAVEIWAAIAVWWPHVKAYRWLWDVVGRHIEAAAATLPSELVTAAQERGKQRELKATAAEVLAELERAGAA